MSKTKKLDVCYASSDEFAIHTGISLLSLLDNNRGIIGTAYILDYGILENNKQNLTGICQKYGVSCTFVPSKEILTELGEKTGIKNFRNSYATYSRAFLDKLLPENVDRVLYIDSDTVAKGSVAELCDYDMTDKVVVGCACSGFYGIRKDKKDRASELDVLTGNTLYIQCGVVMYSLANWRKEGCHEMIMKTAPKLKALPLADQTLINNSIPERLFGIYSQKYNLTSHAYCKKRSATCMMAGGWYTKEEVYDALENAVIIHFAGGPLQRPWYTNNGSRYSEWYLKYKALSPWKDVPLIDRKAFQNIKGFRANAKDFLRLRAMRTNSHLLSRIYGKISGCLEKRIKRRS